MTTRVEPLELEDEPSFQRKEWLIQRIGWVAWVLVLLAGMLGLLGSGPLSSTSSSASDDSLTVRYDRFLHYHQPAMLEVTLNSDAPGEDSARLFVSQPLLERLQISRIEPEPEGRELASDGIIYTFPKPVSVDSATIRFHVQYEAAGNSNGRIALVGHEPASFNQFVYP
jgi:hypothetical protein